MFSFKEQQIYYLLFSLFQILCARNLQQCLKLQTKHLLKFLTFQIIHFLSLLFPPPASQPLLFCFTSFVIMIENMNTVSSQNIICSSGFDLLGIPSLGVCLTLSHSTGFCWDGSHRTPAPSLPISQPTLQWLMCFSGQANYTFNMEICVLRREE